MYCQACGEQPAKRYVSFHQNIGLLVLRFSTACKGDLCGPCIHKYFWTYTAVNLLLGWWGVISFCVTPFFLLNNFLYYVGLLGTESPNGNAGHAPVSQVAQPKKQAGGNAECYLCGKPLEPEERSARVCRACR